MASRVASISGESMLVTGLLDLGEHDEREWYNDSIYNLANQIPNVSQADQSRPSESHQKNWNA